MFVRSSKLILFLFLIPFSDAWGKTYAFASGSPFGIGFKIGAMQAPESDFVPTPQTNARSYSHNFAFEPFLDFGNFMIKGVGAAQYYPLASGAATDSVLSQNYSATSDARSVHYGASLFLAPWISETARSRGFFVLSYAKVNVSLENTRNYLNAAGATTVSNNEKLSGGGQELGFGVGYEFFWVQNYSIQIETGYRALKVSEFTYETEKDLRGNAVAKGSVAKTDANVSKGFTSKGLYGSLSFNLHF